MVKCSNEGGEAGAGDGGELPQGQKLWWRVGVIKTC